MTVDDNNLLSFCSTALMESDHKLIDEVNSVKDDEKTKKQANSSLGNNGDDDSDSAREAEEHLGLLEQPVEIEGKRKRNTVERLTVSSPVVKTHTYKGGSGVSLGSIEFVAKQLAKAPPAELKTMHRILFGHTGKATVIRKDIRAFTGFDFAEDSPEFEKRSAMAARLTTAELRTIKNVLGLQLQHKETGSGSSKEHLVKLLMSFLLRPVDHKKKTAVKRKSKKSGGSGKVKRSKKDKEEHNMVEKEVDSSGDEDSSDKPTEAETNQPVQKEDVEEPFDKDLDKAIRSLLVTFDLTEVTMKQMCQSVIDKCPTYNLTEHKSFLRNKIKSIIAEEQY